MNPPPSLHTPRHGAGIAVLVLYFLLLLLMSLTYFRLLYTVVTNPGYVERSAQWYAQKEEMKRIKPDDSQRLATPFSKKQPHRNRSLGRSNSATAAPLPGQLAGESRPSLQEFFKRDVFICQGDGRPIFCSHCQNWKPDRAHHCREVDRCVRKMDHFCPWVGGVVSETSFKFFTQFVGWTAVFCTFNLILMAILLAEYVRKTGTINAHWVVSLAFAALFGLFTTGMTGSSLQFALLNTTTIENLSRKSVVYQLAIYMPRPPLDPPVFPTITYSTAQNPEDPQSSPNATRTFAILHTKPGENPWDLGVYENFRSVMGEYWLEWFLPIRYSPCCNHDRYDSQFTLGPVVQRMRRDAGITTPIDEEKPHRRRRHRRRRRRSKKPFVGGANEKLKGDEEESPDSGHDRSTNGHSEGIDG